jgi:hypothetical protein
MGHFCFLFELLRAQLIRRFLKRLTGLLAPSLEVWQEAWQAVFRDSGDSGDSEESAESVDLEAWEASGILEAF